jgi:hypothetical protein
MCPTSLVSFHHGVRYEGPWVGSMPRNMMGKCDGRTVYFLRGRQPVLGAHLWDAKRRNAIGNVRRRGGGAAALVAWWRVSPRPIAWDPVGRAVLVAFYVVLYRIVAVSIVAGEPRPPRVRAPVVSLSVRRGFGLWSIETVR